MYEFNVCDRNSYIIETGAMNQGGIEAPVICNVTRKPSLEGRMNIYVAPNGNGTLVTVNCRYVITFNLSSECDFFAPAGNLVNKKQQKDSYTCSLDSRRPSSCEPLKGESFMCHSNGNLENEILSLIN